MKKKVSKILKFFTKKRIIIGLAVILLSLGIYFSRSLIFAAWVNGKPVYRYTLVRELEKQGGKQVLDVLVENSLVNSEARKNNVTISQAEIDTEITNIDKTVSAQGISLNDALSMRGMTKMDLEDQVKMQLLKEKILSPKITITDIEAKDYFTKNKTLFGQNPVYEKVVSQVKNQIFQQKLSTEYTTWITDLKTKAKILYFVNL